jgi:exopolyphosphatase/guanosine-5'-triphosphate,3'-diphosphate pyrophosphatase
MRKAVIDVGSNSVLLTIEEKADAGWIPVYECTDVTSLGEGTKEMGVLSPQAMTRTLAALRSDFAKAREAGCESIFAAATMAARIASNRAEFLELASAQGTPVSILSGEQEAELGFRSVADDPKFSGETRISIVDVGGQSTELVTAERLPDRKWNVLFRRSYPIGTLALRGGALRDETPDARAILKAVCEIDDTIGLIYLPGQCGRAIALGATGTNLVTIRDRMTTWDPARVHGAYLDYEEISKAVVWLCTLDDDQRRHVPGMEPGREKTIHIGALILERFLHSIRSLGCAVSVRGWRHALIEDPIALE